MRGFVFTIDAVAAAAFLVALLSLAFLLLGLQPGPAAPEGHFARDVLAALDGRGLEDGEVRELFLLSNKCGSVVVRDSGGGVADAAYACGCEQGTESVAYRSFVRVTGGSLETLVAEARACGRVGA